MFKTAASKLAHNTTLPVLGGNQDLKPLQDLITSEKTVLIALQKLSTDYTKAAETLRAWGQAEGDDLGDILSASTALLAHFSSALSQYAAHGHTIREHLKAIRSREEALDELRRRRRTVHRKADDADKKLHKMSPENKNLDTQTELLYRLQDEIRTLDSEIMTEEAQLGDFKRSCARRWLGLKFGGLLECCEKGTLVGEYGKLVVAEIPEDTTQPGMPRSLYYGHSKINGLVNDASRLIDAVSFSADLSTAQQPRLPVPPKEESPIGGNQFAPKGPSLDFPTPLSMQYPASINTLPTPSKAPTIDTPISAQPIDDFGVRQDPNAAKFATFPVKLRQDSLPTHTSPFSSQVPPSLNTRHELGDSLSISIAEALSAKKETDTSQPWRGRLSGDGSSLSPTSAAGPPPSGAPQIADNNPWATPPSQHQTLAVHKRDVSTISDDDDALLAYMTSADADTSSMSDSHDNSNDSRPLKEAQPPPPAYAPAINKNEGSAESDTKQARPVSIKVEIEEPQNVPAPVRRKTITRVPPPPLEVEEDERALNAAAARELSREIDEAAFTPPKISSQAQPEVTPSQEQEQEVERHSREQALAVSGGYTQTERAQSPLVPPSAPFAQRAVSPQPLPDSLPRTAAQAYALSFQDSGSPPATQTYAQTYPSSLQGSTNPYDHSPQSNLPPRLQAYQPAEPQNLPPRFQGLRTGSSPIPPRFQNAQINQAPSPMSFSDQSQDNRFHPALVGGNNAPPEQPPRSSIETPYMTPGEYPTTPSGGSLQLGNAPSSPTSNVASQFGPRQQASSPSLSTATTAPLVPGVRTISAAAFKRPQPHPSNSVDNVNSSSNISDPRRTLPTSPRPQSNYSNAPPAQAPAQQQQYQQQYGAPLTNYGGGAPPPQQQQQPQLPHSLVSGPGGQDYQPTPQHQQPQAHQTHHHRVSRDLPPPPPGAAAPSPEPEYDYHFDYISAYQDHDGSPRSGDFPHNQSSMEGGQRPGSGYYVGAGASGYPQQVHGQGSGGAAQQPPPGNGGYATGRYATDLDRGLR